MAGIISDVGGIGRFSEPVVESSKGVDDSEHMQEFRRELLEARRQSAPEPGNRRFDRTV